MTKNITGVSKSNLSSTKKDNRNICIERYGMTDDIQESFCSLNVEKLHYDRIAAEGFEIFKHENGLSNVEARAYYAKKKREFMIRIFEVPKSV